MIVVTGGAGFIGSNIVAALAERGERVVVCDRLRKGEKWRNLAKHAIADFVFPAELPAFLDSAGSEIRAVVHMGAVSSTVETDADLIVESNFKTSLALWRWCALHQVRFLYASSAATYGDGGQGFADAFSPAALAALRPLNAYGWSKHAFDRAVADLLRAGERAPPQWTGLKFFNVYGPNEYHKGGMQSVVAKNYAVAASGGTVRLFKSHRPDYADGGQKRDFVYVMDCVDLVLWLLDQPSVSGLFNLGTGEARSFRELIEALFAATGHPPAIEYVDMPESLRPNYQYFTQADMTRLRAAGWDRPFTSLEAGIGDYVSRFLSREDRFR